MHEPAGVSCFSLDGNIVQVLQLGQVCHNNCPVVRQLCAWVISQPERCQLLQGHEVPGRHQRVGRTTYVWCCHEEETISRMVIAQTHVEYPLHDTVLHGR